MISILITGILPALVLWLYINWRDPQREPIGKLLKALFWGMAICIPVALVEEIIATILFADGESHSVIGGVVNAFFVAAIPEETFKLIALWIVVRHNKAFDEYFDGITYAVSVGLGFAAFENILYLFDSEDWQIVGIMRALLAVPGHYAFAVLMGYYYSLRHFGINRFRNSIMTIAAPVFAHGVYDGILMASEGVSEDVAAGVGLVAFVAVVIFSIKLQKNALRKIKGLIEKDKEQ